MVLMLIGAVSPLSGINADELSDSTEISATNKTSIETESTRVSTLNNSYSSTIDSVSDRWTVGDVIQYSCGAPADATVTWSVTVSGVVSVTNTGLVTALKQGYTILKAEWMNGTTRSSVSTKVYVGTIPDGTYFIGNKQTGKYMDLGGAGTADGTNIQQWDFHGGVQSQWNITLDQYGYYLIQSAYTGKYVGVENSSSSINAGRPLMLGYTEGGAYDEAHMTVCVGYEIDGNTVYVAVSDAHEREYVWNSLYLGTDNDFISKVTPYVQSMN